MELISIKPKISKIAKVEVKPNIPEYKQNQLPEHKRARMEKQQYRLVGNHSAVKICYWCKKSVKGQAECYKNDFYGIPSHQCLEMSPAITCNKRCKHCWRDTSVFSTGWVGPIDDPKEIVEESIRGRYNLLNGFPGNPDVIKEKIEDVWQDHLMMKAISLKSKIQEKLESEL